MTDRHLPGKIELTSEQVRAALSRAGEVEAPDTLTLDEVRAIATEVGIPQTAVNQAVGEVIARAIASESDAASKPSFLETWRGKACFAALGALFGLAPHAIVNSPEHIRIYVDNGVKLMGFATLMTSFWNGRGARRGDYLRLTLSTWCGYLIAGSAFYPRVDAVLGNYLSAAVSTGVVCVLLGCAVQWIRRKPGR